MAKKLKPQYQVCPDETSGWGIHQTLRSALKEAQEELDSGDSPYKVLHICEIREVAQVKPGRKKI
jgi:hypothetical protein